MSETPSSLPSTQTSAGSSHHHNSCNYGGCSPQGGSGGGRGGLAGAVRAEQPRPPLLLPEARSVEVMIRAAPAIYHSLPSRQVQDLPYLLPSFLPSWEVTSVLILGISLQTTV